MMVTIRMSGFAQSSDQTMVYHSLTTSLCVGLFVLRYVVLGAIFLLTVGAAIIEA